jgi:protein tyrosine phosphatase (PTP) superfamily phosphohydrolase (DUF442 family)
MSQSAIINEKQKNSFQSKKQAIMKIFKSVRNILLLLFYRYTPFKPGAKSIEDIFNYMAINDRLASSGQPTQGQFQWIKKADFTVIIDLTTDDFIDNTVKNEREIVTGLGLKYIHIPVVFSNPQRGDFETFVQTMQQVSEEKVWIHCLVNARASSFIYRYRTSVLGENKENALWDLREIWEPFGPWKGFVYDNYFTE